VAEAIVNAAESAGADVIVTSTRALTGPARALLGSTADAVVRTSHCPVLLIHHTRRSEESGSAPTASTSSRRSPGNTV
jgi:nucleotide-binding universal stress UspA family protein